LWREGAFEGHVVPFIRLSGKWLAEAGFQIGDSVTVEVNGGNLVIRREWNLPEEREVTHEVPKVQARSHEGAGLVREGPVQLRLHLSGPR